MISKIEIDTAYKMGNRFPLHGFLPNAVSFHDVPMMSAPEEDSLLCPICEGHGKWNLVLHAYGPTKHFQGGCGQCNGHGWIKKHSINATCIHEHRPATLTELEQSKVKLFSNEHASICKKCGSLLIIDSSD